MTRSALLVAVLAALAAPACKKGGDGEPAPGQRAASAPPRISQEEADRGRQACQSYADQVCECALKISDLAGECDMARARPKALDLNLRAAMADGNATERDRAAIQANAEQIARACIEDTAGLVKRGCPAPERAPKAPTTGEEPARPGSGPVPAPPPEPERIQDQTR